MDLEQSSVVIRRRDAWEALDLGVALGRRYWWRSAAGAALLSLPVLLLGNALLVVWPWAPPLCIWWLKPLFERVPRQVIGGGMFGDRAGVWAGLRATRWPRWPALLALLSWGRLSLVRSYLAPVEQLEEIDGAEGRRRRVVLLGDHAGLAAFVSVLGFIAEVSVWLAVYAFVRLMLPDRIDVDAWFPDYEAADARVPLLVSNALLWAVQVAVMPYYTAMGFSLYLKRRVDLEGWDLELVFRRLTRRIAQLGRTA